MHVSKSARFRDGALMAVVGWKRRTGAGQVRLNLVGGVLASDAFL